MDNNLPHDVLAVLEKHGGWRNTINALAAAEKEAARYRYLRDGYGDTDEISARWFSAYDTLGGPYTPAHVDAAIDQAIAALSTRGAGDSDA